MILLDYSKIYLNYCELQKGLNPKTLKAYSTDLKQFFEFLGNYKPDKAKIEEFIIDLKKKFRQKTVKRKIAALKAFFSYLEDNEIIKENPFNKIKVTFNQNDKLPRTIPKGEIEQLMNCMYTHMNKNQETDSARYILRDIAVIEFLYATGARVSEASNLTLDCIDLNSGKVRILGKRGKERYVQICNEKAMEAIIKYYKANEEAIKESGFFFINSNKRRYSEQSIRLMLKKYVKKAGIKRNITPHMFRHSFATSLIEGGANIFCLQKILGHSSIKTTQIYVSVSLDAQVMAMKNFHPRNDMNIIGFAS